MVKSMDEHDTRISEIKFSTSILRADGISFYSKIMKIPLKNKTGVQFNVCRFDYKNVQQIKYLK